jgi:hypothetical protein
MADEMVPEVATPQPKKRGRPPGSKNRTKEPPPPTEEPEASEPETSEPEATEPEDSEPEEAAPPRAAPPPVKPPKPAKPVRMQTPPRKEPKKQKSKQPRQNTPAPPPTAEEIAEAMMTHMTSRHYNKSMQRQAMYSSWL